VIALAAVGTIVVVTVFTIGVMAVLDHFAKPRETTPKSKPRQKRRT